MPTMYIQKYLDLQTSVLAQLNKPGDVAKLFTQSSLIACGYNCDDDLTSFALGWLESFFTLLITKLENDDILNGGPQCEFLVSFIQYMHGTHDIIGYSELAPQLEDVLPVVQPTIAPIEDLNRVMPKFLPPERAAIEEQPPEEGPHDASVLPLGPLVRLLKEGKCGAHLINNAVRVLVKRKKRGCIVRSPLCVCRNVVCV